MVVFGNEIEKAHSHRIREIELFKCGSDMRLAQFLNQFKKFHENENLTLQLSCITK